MDNWTNFEKEEFECSHCGFNDIETETVDRLQELRDRCPFPFVVSSGYRCKNHPDEIKKLTVGPHTTGKAVDIVCSHKSALMIVAAAMEQDFFQGYGISQRGNIDTRFVHLDWCDETRNRPRPHLWSY